jgi:hypothetical protein
LDEKPETKEVAKNIDSIMEKLSKANAVPALKKHLNSLIGEVEKVKDHASYGEIRNLLSNAKGFLKRMS